MPNTFSFHSQFSNISPNISHSRKWQEEGGHEIRTVRKKGKFGLFEHRTGEEWNLRLDKKDKVKKGS